MSCSRSWSWGASSWTLGLGLEKKVVFTSLDYDMTCNGLTSHHNHMALLRNVWLVSSETCHCPLCTGTCSLIIKIHHSNAETSLNCTRNETWSQTHQWSMNNDHAPRTHTHTRQCSDGWKQHLAISARAYLCICCFHFCSHIPACKDTDNYQSYCCTVIRLVHRCLAVDGTRWCLSHGHIHTATQPALACYIKAVAVETKNKNSSGHEIANANFFRMTSYMYRPVPTPIEPSS